MKQLFNDKNRTIIDVNHFDMIQKDELTKYIPYMKEHGEEEKPILYRIVLTKITHNYDEDGRPFINTFTVTLGYDSEKKRNTDYNKITEGYNAKKQIGNYIPYNREVRQ